MTAEDRRNFFVPDKEPYTCEHCGASVMGGRYNNHCPNCLWSKHVDDKIPGDRASECNGLMKPVGVTQERGKWRIIQECVSCGHTFKVDRHPEDNFEVIISLSQKPLKT